MNMATDWWLFENAKVPSFRHYQWKQVETSFGYGQDWQWVAKQTNIPVHDLIRRPTGGGIVRHGYDWTYCLVLPKSHQSFSIPPRTLYKELHNSIGKGLESQGVQTVLQPCGENKKAAIPGDCFLEPVSWDLMDSEACKKIAGAAMKRTRNGVLVQGTVDLRQKWSINKELFLEDIIKEVAHLLDESPEIREWPKELSSLREGFVSVFSSIEWKRERRKI